MFINTSDCKYRKNPSDYRIIYFSTMSYINVYIMCSNNICVIVVQLYLLCFRWYLKLLPIKLKEPLQKSTMIPIKLKEVHFRKVSTIGYTILIIPKVKYGILAQG